MQGRKLFHFLASLAILSILPVMCGFGDEDPSKLLVTKGQQIDGILVRASYREHRLHVAASQGPWCSLSVFMRELNGDKKKG